MTKLRITIEGIERRYAEELGEIVERTVAMADLTDDAGRMLSVEVEVEDDE